MPRGDGTGPLGLGPMTGRAAGYCAGFPVPGFMNPIPGRLGLGLGWGRAFWPHAYYGWARFPALPYAYPWLPHRFGMGFYPYGYLPRMW